MSRSRISWVKVLMSILKEKLEHQCDQMVILSKKQILSLQHFSLSLLWFAWISENHNTAPFSSKTQFQVSSNQTLYFYIYNFIHIYYIHIYTFFKSPRICPHCNYSQKSCTVYFGDACEDTLFQHVFKFQNLTLHWYLTLLLYFRWGYFPLKHSIFTTHPGNK